MRSIVLIGPYGVGKSTIAQLLAEACDQKSHSLDECIWTYYREAGLSLETAEALGDFDSPQWQPYHVHAVKRFLQDHHNEVCVMDLGAGHALYEGTYLDEMRVVLARYDVVLLLPSPDIDVSIHDLTERNNAHVYKRTQPHAEWNTFFLRHPSSRQLASYIVYTKGKTAMETCHDILVLNRGNRSGG